MTDNLNSQEQSSVASSFKKPRLYNQSDSSYTRTNIHTNHHHKNTRSINNNNNNLSMDICEEELEL